jgi:hypothetical protein
MSEEKPTVIKRERPLEVQEIVAGRTLHEVLLEHQADSDLFSSCTNVWKLLKLTLGNDICTSLYEYKYDSRLMSPEQLYGMCKMISNGIAYFGTRMIDTCGRWSFRSDSWGSLKTSQPISPQDKVYAYVNGIICVFDGKSEVPKLAIECVNNVLFAMAECDDPQIENYEQFCSLIKEIRVVNQRGESKSKKVEGSKYSPKQLLYIAIKDACEVTIQAPGWSLKIEILNAEAKIISACQFMFISPLPWSASQIEKAHKIYKTILSYRRDLQPADEVKYVACQQSGITYVYRMENESGSIDIPGRSTTDSTWIFIPALPLAKGLEVVGIQKRRVFGDPETNLFVSYRSTRDNHSRSNALDFEVQLLWDTLIKKNPFPANDNSTTEQVHAYLSNPYYLNVYVVPDTVYRIENKIDFRLFIFKIVVRNQNCIALGRYSFCLRQGGQGDFETYDVCVGKVA